MPLVPFTHGSGGQIHLTRDHGNKEEGSKSVSPLVTREGNEVPPSLKESLSMFIASGPLAPPEETEHLVTLIHWTPFPPERNCGTACESQSGEVRSLVISLPERGRQEQWSQPQTVKAEGTEFTVQPCPSLADQTLNLSKSQSPPENEDVCAHPTLNHGNRVIGNESEVLRKHMVLIQVQHCEVWGHKNSAPLSWLQRGKEMSSLEAGHGRTLVGLQ